MHEEVENKRTPPKKPFIFYAVIAFVVIMLLNALVFPSMMKKSVVEVGYDQFLEMIDENQVREVACFYRGDGERISDLQDWNLAGVRAAASPAAAGSSGH